MKRAIALVAVVVLALAACSPTGDDDDETGSTGSTEPTTEAPSTEQPQDEDEAEEAPAPELAWESCAGGFECATLDVPVNYDQPEGETLEVAVTRLPAEDQDERIGSLLMNPGGPGGSAVEFVQAVAPALPADLVSRFDIVGFDPRGVGDSTRVDCGDITELYSVDPTIEDPADRDALIAASEDYIGECESEFGELLPHLGTENVARDMDRLREALGDDQLTYVGFSYGTSIGQTYANLFPDNIRAMVLDGVVDIEKTGVEGATTQAGGFELAFGNFIDDCMSSACPLGAEPVATVERVMAAAEQAPIPAPGADRPAGPGEVSLGLAGALYSETLWPDLQDAVVDADQGDGSGLVALADDYLSGGGFSIYFAVSCLDSEWPEDPQEILDAGKDAAAESPHFGEAILTDYIRCALWPTEEQPLPPVEAEGSPTILVISTTGDPATPYESGVELADTLPNGVLLSYEGEGHTIFANGVPCVDDQTTTYLVDLEAPPDETTC